MVGFTLRKPIGLGDAVQFTSVPENYYRTYGELLFDDSNHWCFDYNPYVTRDPELRPSFIKNLWDFSEIIRPPNRPLVYSSMAERHAYMMQAKCFMKYPRLYRFEDFPIEKRETILLHTHGVSHGAMPDHVIDHVLKKYKNMNLIHVGLPSDPDLGISKAYTPDMWSLVKLISECRIFIGVDSGPSWIAACYPDVIIKKLRTKPSIEELRNWIPLQIDNIHSYWDDRFVHVHNDSEDDIGMTSSYRRI